MRGWLGLGLVVKKEGKEVTSETKPLNGNQKQRAKRCVWRMENGRQWGLAGVDDGTSGCWAGGWRLEEVRSKSQQSLVVTKPKVFSFFPCQ